MFFITPGSGVSSPWYHELAWDLWLCHLLFILTLFLMFYIVCVWGSGGGA